MKRAIVSIGLLLLCSSAALAEKVNAPSADLASFLSSLRDTGSCPTPTATAARKGLRSITAQSVTCTAHCSPYTDVTCTVEGSCSAVDRNCGAGQQGYIVCNGAYTYCPACACIENDMKWVEAGCCSGGRLRTKEFTCINGVWTLTGISCDGTCF